MKNLIPWAFVMVVIILSFSSMANKPHSKPTIKNVDMESYIEQTITEYGKPDIVRKIYKAR